MNISQSFLGLNAQRILAVGAHFDDIEINCGGTIAKAAQNGSTIKLVVGGNGNYKDHEGKVLRSHSQALEEQHKAIELLGLKEDSLIALGYPEQAIPFSADSIGRLESIIYEFKPDIIFTHGVSDTHQDHKNIGETVLAAARFYYSILIWEPIFPSNNTALNHFYPQVYSDISNFHAQKLGAIRCHESQIEKYSKFGIDWIEGIEARARYRGYESGAKYAEAFQALRLRLNLSADPPK